MHHIGRVAVVASQDHQAEAQEPNRAAIDRVVKRLGEVYRRWTRDASNTRMRQDWDDLFWSEAMPARVEPLIANGVNAAWVGAADVNPGKVAIYFHGGGFRLGSLRSHRDLPEARSALASLGAFLRRALDAAA